jgi:hypothetical protein
MPPASSGAYNSVKQALSIFSPFNKMGGGAMDGQGTPEQVDEYESTMSEEEIIQLTGTWKRDYDGYYRQIKESQDTSYDYWLGKQTKKVIEDMLDSSRSVVDNKLFSALETFLPIATRANPDPLVTIDPSVTDQRLGDLVRNSLSYQADRQKLRMLLKAMVRDWALSRIGVMKVGWDYAKGDIKTDIINPKRMIFDKDGYVAEGGIFTGEYIGERKKLPASVLVELFPKKAQFIREKAGSKMATKLDVIEWWYHGTDWFYTLDDTVLGKFKNHLWNYDGTVTKKGPTGNDVEMDVQGQNHFELPQSPYIFLSIFSTRTQPHDDTSLFMQNLSIQDLINRRFRQIDDNANNTNNGLVVNGAFNSEQASLASAALRKGGAIRVPGETTNVRDAVMHLDAPGLDNSVRETLVDARNELQDIFGIAGSTPQGVEDTDTVRGKILINQLDASRIGGGVTEYIEQVADTWYNWCVQIMYVHYDEPHYAAALGTQGAQELIQIRSSDLQGKILVTVKEGSLIPKDPMTRRNEAIDLWSANAIDPITFYQKLDYPDPHSAAEQLLVWQMIQKGALPPQVMFPDFPGQPMQAAVPQQQPGTGGPAVSPPGQQGIQNEPAPPGSAPAVAQESQSLLASIPTQ